MKRMEIFLKSCSPEGVNTVRISLLLYCYLVFLNVFVVLDIVRPVCDRRHTEQLAVLG